MNLGVTKQPVTTEDRNSRPGVPNMTPVLSDIHREGDRAGEGVETI